MLLSPRSFRMKVNGSFYPPSSSGVGTFPTRPDKPWPRRTASVRRTDVACGEAALHEQARIDQARLTLKEEP